MSVGTGLRGVDPVQVKSFPSRSFKNIDFFSHHGLLSGGYRNLISKIELIPTSVFKVDHLIKSTTNGFFDDTWRVFLAKAI